MASLDHRRCIPRKKPVVEDKSVIADKGSMLQSIKTNENQLPHV